MASICGKRLKYLRYGFSMLAMAYEFDKRLKYVGNNVYMDLWELTKICGKWLKHLTNGLNMQELTERFGKWLKQLGNGLDIWSTP